MLVGRALVVKRLANATVRRRSGRRVRISPHDDARAARGTGRRCRTEPVRMNLDVLWHDLECGAYGEDLPLWRALAGEAGGSVLDVGAGTGRVALDLAAGGVAVVALDADASLLATLEHRAAGLPVETLVADAREFATGRRFALVIVPMQTLQLLGGPSGRAAFLRRTLDHLEPGGLLAAALADAVDCFDAEHDVPPPPDACEIDGVRYASHLLAVEDEGGRAAIHRLREIVGPDERYQSQDVVVRLDRVSAHEVAIEAAELGFVGEPNRFIAPTEEYLGSTVVVLRAP
jgi:SAM-dependent methyltransferase